MEEHKRGCCFKWLIAAVVLSVIVVAGGYGVKKICQRRAVNRAQEQLKKGFGALAAETLDGYRHHLVKSADDCKTLILSYSAARRGDRLEWTGEACLDNKIETLEVYQGLASAEDLLGRDADAIQVLNLATQKFPKTPELYLSMARILRKNKDDDHAVQAIMKAVEVAGDNGQLLLESLQYFSSINRVNEAKLMADRLKNAQTDNPEVKLLIARALLKGGDKEGAKTQAAQGKDLLAKAPAERKAAIEKAYSDVMNLH